MRQFLFLLFLGLGIAFLVGGLFVTRRFGGPMKRYIFLVTSLWPVSAHAERMFSEGLVALFYWYILLVLFLLWFLAFTSFGGVRKICALAAAILVTVAAWLLVLDTTISAETWVETLKYLSLWVSPVVGFLCGFHIGKPRGNAS